MSQEVYELAQLGPLPSSDASEELITKYEKLLASIVPPISDDDAKTLVKLFGPDDCYGLAWTMIHLIETAPSWPITECFEQSNNEWIEILKIRASNTISSEID